MSSDRLSGKLQNLRGKRHGSMEMTMREIELLNQHGKQSGDLDAALEVAPSIR
jgi:hypothetical protein